MRRRRQFARSFAATAGAELRRLGKFEKVLGNGVKRRPAVKPHAKLAKI